MPQSLSSTLSSALDAGYDFAAARRAMVRGQLCPNGVTDPYLLAAMETIEREQFVPSHLVGVAYADSDIPLINGRFLIRPLVFARLAQAARLSPRDRVLDLAPATGYSTLVLAELAQSVIAIEPDPVLCKAAAAIAARANPLRAQVLFGAAEGGYAAQAPFDAIFVNGAVDEAPPALLGQLAEGGRLLAVRHTGGDTGLTQMGLACLWRKRGGLIEETRLFDATLPDAPGFAKPHSFRF